MTAAKKLALVVAIQFLVLFSVIGFKQYTLWTGKTVLLKVQPVDPRDLLRGDFIRVQYEISTVDESTLAGDDNVYGTVYVELQQGEDGYWHAAALHNDRERTFEGTALIKGDVRSTPQFNEVPPASQGPIPSRPQFNQQTRKTVEYGIEEIFIPEGSGADLPRGRDHTIGVEAKVDRFGNAIPRHFVVDGEQFDLHRR